ncbi:hypothetical protein FisN_4Lu608 [Fistulifera solaris]|uniref:Uncharacterized protein n=1 Tax=Fistulifera solaris TaxID=1519565 RepID=A0A1Z5KDK5_FISSO|nr:hypothetical protein FisN_4Lu608 [Fistulifera solaris]|eukprot:GAX24380.1 hypothetical protein FisN_4Lu608 [Fistulifera solaris]
MVPQFELLHPVALPSLTLRTSLLGGPAFSCNTASNQPKLKECKPKTQSKPACTSHASSGMCQTIDATTAAGPNYPNDVRCYVLNQ